ncbi:MAG: glycosyltransferase [Patiriisocius sp.]|uniref:glycosyltransferase n=1 Tax=Patiriisocius sp. TaxID=2822396 RepID=UPI003EFA50A4
MRILIVALPTIHTSRWYYQLEQEGHELYFFNIMKREIPDSFVKMNILEWEHSALGNWTLKSDNRIIKKIGRLFLRSFYDSFKKAIDNVQPDFVHSLNMNMSYTIIPFMEDHPNIPWVCNTWGNDIYYFQHLTVAGQKIKRMLARLDYLFSDTQRDIELAKQNGFKGKVLGVYPGGGGYKIPNKIKPVEERDTIMLKGYEHSFGRALNVLNAIVQSEEHTKKYKIFIFSAHQPVVEFALKMQEMGYNIVVKSTKDNVPHEEILNIMQQSILYIGNSISDGMPNTLLEAIVSGAFPIQSNPGGATAEIIKDGVNGFLINDPEDTQEIAMHVKNALTNKKVLVSAQHFNKTKIAPNLSFETIKTQVIEKYHYLEEEILGSIK